MQGFSWGDAASSAALGSRRGREIFQQNIIDRQRKSADRIITSDDKRFFARLVAEDLAERKERGDLRRENLYQYLPDDFRAALEEIASENPIRGTEREDAILRKVGWEGLELLKMDAEELADEAKKVAARYAAAHPKDDPNFHKPEHKRGRCEKVQGRRLRKVQRNALKYVSAVVKAVGGPNHPLRPLYISDYALKRYRQQERRTAAVLEKLRLIKKNDPKTQIPLSELNVKAQIADTTKRRLLVDMMLTRWRELGWYVCWITVSLPGEYVPHSTNEGRRATEWDVENGPEEAFAAIQDDHHRVLARLRERGVRPTGWWNAQPQQSGTPHRHYVLACESLEDARAVCDGFRESFSTRIGEGEDRGCAAFVIGDEDPSYAPRKGKDGSVETADSIAKYAARYSTRMEVVADGEEVDLDDLDRPASDFERYKAWKNLNGCRTHAWLGLDSRRAPGELWDTLWANAQRSEYDPADARMAIAMREMRDVQTYVILAVEARKAAEDAENDEDKANFAETIRIANEDAAFSAWHAAVALGMWPDADLDQDELDWLRYAIEEWNKEHGETDIDPLPPMPLREVKISTFDEEYKKTTGAVGAVRKFDIGPTASASTWLLVAQSQGVMIEDPANGRIGIRHIKRAIRRSGIDLSRRPDGWISGYDLSGEILMRVMDEWEIVDEETAKKRIEEAEAAAPVFAKSAFSTSEEEKALRAESSALMRKIDLKAKSANMRYFGMGDVERYQREFPEDVDVIELQEKVRLSMGFLKTRIAKRVLSFNPTDPSLGPAAPPMGEKTPDDGPPD